MRHKILSLGLSTLYRSGAHKVFGAKARGLGAILMMHHVRPWVARPFAPNRLLEITPEFLDETLTLIRAQGYETIPLDHVPARLQNPQPHRPFVAITLDDGYRDTVEHALPVFRKHNTPFTVFVTTGFADATAPLWWLDMEEAISLLDRVEIDLDGKLFNMRTKTIPQKYTAFKALYWKLRHGPELRLRSVIASLCEKAGVHSLATVRRLCLDWEGILSLSHEPLVTIGAHTLTHPMLAKYETAFARQEIANSKIVIGHELGKPVQHFAYPVGDKGSAGSREFLLAEEAGFATALTTRPGVLFAEHASHLHALPRLSVNGLFQRGQDLEVLLSGVPFALFNRGRKLNVS